MAFASHSVSSHRSTPERAVPAALHLAHRRGGHTRNPIWHHLATRVTPKVRISQPGDPSETEAGRVAESVLRAPGAGTRKVSGPDRHRARVFGEGTPLPDAARRYFEPRFGQGFGDVRIHTGGHAAAAARELNSLACTTGRDIFFAAAQYDPYTNEGRRLLAHELAHTLEQKDAATGPVIQRLVPDTGANTSASAAGITSFELSPSGEYDEVSPAGNPAGHNEMVAFDLNLTSTATPSDYAVVQLVKGSMSYRDAAGDVQYIDANIGGAMRPFHYHDWKVDSKNSNPEYGTTHTPPVSINSAVSDWSDEPGISPGSLGAELPVPTRFKVWFRTGIYRRPIPATASAFESSRPAPLAELRWAIHWRNEGNPPSIVTKEISPA